MNIKILFLIITSLASIPFAMAGPERSKVSQWTKELVKLKNIGGAIQFYQADYGVSTWPTLETLFAAEEKNIEDIKKQFGTFVDPVTGKSFPWLYMPEGKPVHGARFIVIAAPLVRPGDEASKGKEWRPVLWSDFTAEFLDEVKFQERLNRKRHR